MSELPNFPFLNQLTDNDENSQFDCVPTSLAAGANYLLGKSAINAPAMKDAIYGDGYIGGTAASAFVNYLKARGIRLYSVQGTYPDLIKQAHQHLAAGHPVVFTRDDPYAPARPEWSHVCVWYRDTPTSLTCMDPYGGYAVTKSDAEWMPLLRFNEFWIMEKAMIDIGAVAGYFTDLGNDVWECKTTGARLGHGMLGYWRRLPAPLAMLGLPRTGEIAVPGHTGVVIQVFERAILAWDPAHTLDNPPGAGPVYAMHIDQPEGLGLKQLQTLLKITPAPGVPASIKDDLLAIQTATEAGISNALAALGLK